jgi:hypothetical protein
MPEQNNAIYPLSLVSNNSVQLQYFGETLTKAYFSFVI